MSNKSLFCSIECKEEETVFNCESCKSPIHEKCVRSVDEIKKGTSAE